MPLLAQSSNHNQARTGHPKWRKAG